LTIAKLLPGTLQDGTKVRRIGHEEALDLLFVLYANDNRDCAAVARDHDWPALTSL
jgi:hypothetical protein